MRTLLTVFALCASTGVGLAADAPQTSLNPAALSFKLPKDITWRDPEGSPTNQAVLFGDPNKPGLYVIMNKFQPGNYSRPHYHPNDRYITVLKGTWWVSTSARFDPEHNAVPMPVGAFVTHFANAVHYDGAKDEEVIVLITGIGPATGVQCADHPTDAPCARAPKN